MKNILILFYLLANIVYSQENEILITSETDSIKLTNRSYYFTQSEPITNKLQSLINDGEEKIVDLALFKADYKITVLYEQNNKVYYRYWYFNNNEKLKEKYNNDKVFSMPKKSFEQLTEPLYRRYKGVSAGAYTIPFRLRGIGDKENFDFESSLSLQANVVFGFGSRKSKTSWIDLSFGLGLTGVNLNEDNSTVPENRTASAFTISLGGVLKPNRFINVGLFTGWDYLGRSDKDANWVHDGDTWLGMGVNISFNEIKTNKSATDSNANK